MFSLPREAGVDASPRPQGFLFGRVTQQGQNMIARVCGHYMLRKFDPKLEQ